MSIRLVNTNKTPLVFILPAEERGAVFFNEERLRCALYDGERRITSHELTGSVSRGHLETVLFNKIKRGFRFFNAFVSGPFSERLSDELKLIQYDDSDYGVHVASTLSMLRQERLVNLGKLKLPDSKETPLVTIYPSSVFGNRVESDSTIKLPAIAER